jgi:diguanylate cyclase (GGDEF)-like protein
LVLKALAAILADSARGPDIVCRLGGEEFVMLLAHAPGEAAQRVAERIMNAVRAARVETEAGGQISFRVSIGIAFSRPDDCVDSLLSRADKALYQAKETGRDCWVMDEAARH